MRLHEIMNVNKEHQIFLSTSNFKICFWIVFKFNAENHKEL